MRRISVTATLLLLPVLLSSACERTKSATPLSPSLAGPIAGVEISQPASVAPVQNVRIPSTEQPLTLTVQNAATNGVRPLSYLFEIATDESFNVKVFTQTGVTPGDGQTSFRMPNPLAAERLYFWRAKAYDGANEGDYSPAGSFAIYTPVVVGTPSHQSPGNGSTVTTRQPTLQVSAASVSGPSGSLSYLFEVATDGSMLNRVAVHLVAGTSLALPNSLVAQTTYYWRVRAVAESGHEGPWTAPWSFITPNAVVAPPPPSSGGGAPPAANDQIDLNKVVFAKGSNISGWSVTSTVTKAYHQGADMCIEHSMAGRWPRIPWLGDPNVPVEGNQWFFAQIGGQWYGGANEWLRPGQTCKIVEGHVGQGGFGGTALGNWTPQPGEVVGVGVSTPARNGQEGAAERSNVVLIRW